MEKKQQSREAKQVPSAKQSGTHTTSTPQIPDALQMITRPEIRRR